MRAHRPSPPLGPGPDPSSPRPPPAPVSEEVQRWLDGAGEKTLGSIIELFGEKSFALLFVFLLGVPALPLPTGGATHVFEIIAVLLAIEMIAGRREIWPARALVQDRSRREAASGASSRG